MTTDRSTRACSTSTFTVVLEITNFLTCARTAECESLNASSHAAVCVCAWKLVTQQHTRRHPQHHTHKYNERLSHQYRYEPPPEFPLTLPFSGTVHHFRVPTLMLLLKTLSRSRWVAGLVLTHKACNNTDTAMSACVKRQSRQARLIQPQFLSSNYRHFLRLLPS